MHKTLVDLLNSKVTGCNATLVEAEVGDHTIFVEASHILDVCFALRDDETHNFTTLEVVTGCDYEDRIEVSYVLASFTKNLDLILKTKLPRENPEIESVYSVWKSANFQERETYDMLGVVFKNHPDLRRILCPYDWEGFPLRRDYKTQETYMGMTVDPEEKVNRDDHHYFKKIQEELGDPKKVMFSWKGE